MKTCVRDQAKLNMHVKGGAKPWRVAGGGIS